MKREIEFRIWDKAKEDKWKPQGMVYFGLGQVPSIFNNTFVPENSNSFEERCVLMQYTGLTDKNGKKIFEGDIVEYSTGFISEVIFKEGCFISYDGRSESSNDAYCDLVDDCPPFMNPFSIEVIGNIHQNKELIK